MALSETASLWLYIGLIDGKIHRDHPMISFVEISVIAETQAASAPSPVVLP